MHGSRCAWVALLATLPLTGNVRDSKNFCEQPAMAGALAREANVRWSGSSTTGGPFPARVGAFGSPCTAHAHTRARAHARARPRCTLQNTIPLHCTSTTTAHFCTCTLTCSRRSGAGGRGGHCRARHGRAAPFYRHREPPRGLQPLGASTHWDDKVRVRDIRQWVVARQ